MTDSDFVDVRGDGRIVLYKRAGLKKPKWQARIRVPNANRYKIVTTKTDDLLQAQVFAINLYEETYLTVKSGGSLSTKSFKQVFDEWKKSLGDHAQTRQGGSWTATINRVSAYALDYFGAKKIDQIKSADFAEFLIWRTRNFVRKPPSAATLKREKVCLMPVLKYAKQRGYIKDIPNIDTPKFKAQRRSTFTETEWRTFYTKARSWVRDAEHLATWRDRYVAQQAFLILANTGMRVGELRYLRWSDLRTFNVDDDKRMIAWVQGKTGAREVAFQPSSDIYVKRLYDLRVKELEAAPDSESFVVCHRDGSAIQSFKKSFVSLMEYAEIPLVRNAMTRTVYSLRHFYATKRLEQDASPFLLAKQMGTSVEMLEKFYGQTTINATTIKGVTKGDHKRMTATTGKYPFE